MALVGEGKRGFGAISLLYWVSKYGVLGQTIELFVLEETSKGHLVQPQMYQWSFWSTYRKELPQSCSMECRGGWQQCISLSTSVTPPQSILLLEPWAPVQLLLAGSPQGLMKAEFLNNSSPQRRKTTPPTTNDPVQHFKYIWCVSLHLPATLQSHMLL